MFVTPPEKEFYETAPLTELQHVARHQTHRWEQTAKNMGIIQPDFYQTGILGTNTRLYTPRTLAKAEEELNLGTQLAVKQLEQPITITKDWVLVRMPTTNEVIKQALITAKALGTPCQPVSNETKFLPARDQVLLYTGEIRHTGYEGTILAQKVFHDAEQKDNKLGEEHPHGLVSIVANNNDEAKKFIEDAQHWAPKFDNRPKERATEIIRLHNEIEEATESYHGIITLPTIKEIPKKTIKALRKKLLPQGRMFIPTDLEGNYEIIEH